MVEGIYLAIRGIKQPDVLYVNDHLRIRKPCKGEWGNALPWYQNKKVMHFSEGISNRAYNLKDVGKMYDYLSSIGELYFIEIYEDKWKSIGDVTLAESNFPIVIGVEKYWGCGIGKKVIKKLISRAKRIGITKLTIPEIYLYNHRSKRLFTSLGFIKIGQGERAESFELVLL